MSETGAQSIDAPKRGVDLPDVLRMFARSLSLSLRVSEPVRVTVWHSALSRVDVSTEILTAVRGNTPATADVETPLAPVPLMQLPVLSVPSLLWGISVPITVGDLGVVLYTDRSLERYKAAGVADVPGDARAHSRADGLFIHGINPNGVPLVPPPDPAALELRGPAIKLGELATQPAVLGTALVEALSTFIGTVAAANTTWGGNPVSAPAFSTALGGALVDLGTALATVLSLKVRVE